MRLVTFLSDYTLSRDWIEVGIKTFGFQALENSPFLVVFFMLTQVRCYSDITGFGCYGKCMLFDSL